MVTGLLNSMNNFLHLDTPVVPWCVFAAVNTVSGVFASAIGHMFHA
jgi:hypothetical protein